MAIPLSLCVVLATAASPARAGIVVGSGWDGPGQNAASLGYYFVNATADLDAVVQQAEVLRALNLWSKYADITWTPAASAGLAGAVDIGWYTGSHGDASPFTGPGGSLAHSFYPGTSTSSGDIHFDDAETWITGYLTQRTTVGGTITYNEANLFSVALHESGHALGLGHSPDTKSAMYSAYYGGRWGNALSPDDIATLRSLYAARYPTFSAHIWGRHTFRSDLMITIGVAASTTGATLWSTEVAARIGGALDDFDFDEIDLTDALPYLNATNDWFVRIQDVSNEAVGGDTGTGWLDGFTIRYGTPGHWTTLSSPDLGVIPDPGTMQAWILDSGSVFVVPEPNTLALLGLGMLWMTWAHTRRRRRTLRLVPTLSIECAPARRRPW